MDQSTRLFLLRHGEVEDRYRYVFGGRIDMDLSPRGREQVKRLAEHLCQIKLDRIYVSPLKRARQTSSALLQHDGRTETVHRDLREVDFGQWTGLTWAEVAEQFGVHAFDWLRALRHDRIPGAEPFSEFHGRVSNCLNDILGRHSGQSVAVVCHGGVIRMLLALLLDLPLEKTAGFEVDYASLTVVGWERPGPAIRLLNFTPWRPLP
ncbi:MAG: histidine phosphatase family protein [Verrucomicrobiia bacterium]